MTTNNINNLMDIDSGNTEIYTPSYLHNDYYKIVFNKSDDNSSSSSYSSYSNNNSICSNENISVPSTFYLNSISSQETQNSNLSYSFNSYSTTSSYETSLN